MSEDPPLDQRTTISEGGSGSLPLQEHRQIGPYRILEKRGEGGMGAVYLAEQAHPVKRQVALKIIKPGMDTREVITRFEAERQALAMMDHPAIASIYDAGATPEGRPYFVMEYVQGVPITEYCDRDRLTVRERIDLFAQVCAGVQHAHQKAVIHRDLKPTNVLVSQAGDRPSVKIIDFGLAKALAERLTERTLHTRFGAIVGTIEYMSPEQADPNQDIDTRSDVFSLGVMLYELLVGTLPFGSRGDHGTSGEEVWRRVRELDPARPSARLSSPQAGVDVRAHERRSEPQALRRELKGDLDWIVLRALEKDRARRYGSAAELAADLKRFLNHEPVLARAPSAGYRARKFVRRHRLGVAAAALVVLSLAAGLVGSTVGLVRARRAEAQVRAEAESKDRVAGFLKDLFRVSDPSEARGNSITARELLDKAAGTMDAQLSGQPRIQAELSEIMGQVYLGLGLYAAAETLMSKAVDLNRNALGPEHPRTLNSMNSLGAVYGLQNRTEEEGRLRAQVLEASERVLPPEHPDRLAAMMNMATSHHRKGHLAEAEQLYSEVLQVQRRVLGVEHRHTLRLMRNLAVVYLGQSRFAEAERACIDLLAIQKRVLGAEHPDTLVTMTTLMDALQEQHRDAEAEQLGTQILETQRRILGPEHPDTLSSLGHLSHVYQKQGRYDQSEKLDLETLEIVKRQLGSEHPQALWLMNNLALSYQSRGRLDEAERLHLETLEIRQRAMGPTHPDTLVSYYNLACVAALRGDRSRAMEWLRKDVEGGDTDVESLETDPELASLHGPEFDALLGQVRRNAAAARAAVAAAPSP